MHSNEWGYTLLSHGRLDGLKINTLNVLNIYCRCDLHETLRRSFYFDEIDKLPEMYLESESIHDSQNSYEEYLQGHQNPTKIQTLGYFTVCTTMTTRLMK